MLSKFERWTRVLIIYRVVHNKLDTHIFKGGDRQKSIFMDFSEHPFILLEIFFYFQIFKNESKILKLKGAAIYLKNSYFERF